MPGGLVFATTPDNSTTPTEKMRITSSGSVGIGVSNPSGKLEVGGNITTTGPIILIEKSELLNGEVLKLLCKHNSRYGSIGVKKIDNITDNATGFLILSTNTGNTNNIWVDNSNNLRISTDFAHIGTTSGTVIGTQTSDERLKNISTNFFPYGLQQIKSISPIKYTFKNDIENIQKLGFSAQQCINIIPESVFDTKEVIENEDPNLTKLGMDYSQLIPVLVKAIQELSAKVEEVAYGEFACIYSNSSTVTVASSSVAKIPLNSSVFSSGISLNTSTNVWTHSNTGKYKVSLTFRQANVNSSTGINDVWCHYAVKKNNASVVGRSARIATSSNGSLMSLSFIYNVDSTTDTYGIYGWANFSTGLTVAVGPSGFANQQSPFSDANYLEPGVLVQIEYLG
jgi:hypothetical protein